MPKKGINIYKRRKHWVQKWKMHHGCGECGYNKCPEALHLDHLFPGAKHSMVKNGIRRTSYGGGMANLYRAMYPVEVLITEIRKCQILCANCHAEKSAEERSKGKRG